MGIQSSARIWAPGTAPLRVEPSTGRPGRPRKLLRRAPGHEPASVKALALGLDISSYGVLKWREGTRASLSSRFAAVRVRASHRDYRRATQRDEEWLLIEWPQGDPEPAKYWLSTLPDTTSLQRLVNVAKMRWRTERDYQDLKQEFGLGHFEGRSSRGFHHHASLCIAAYGFLIAQRLIQATADSAASSKASEKSTRKADRKLSSDVRRALSKTKEITVTNIFVRARAARSRSRARYRTMRRLIEPHRSPMAYRA